MYTTPITNALTGRIYPDKYEGSAAETDFYRVMPLHSCRKLFFDSLAEYRVWFEMQYGYALTLQETTDPPHLSTAGEATTAYSDASGTEGPLPVGDVTIGAVAPLATLASVRGCAGG